MKTPAQMLGQVLSRMADRVLLGRADKRCATCAFRDGVPANETGNTLLSTLKCSSQRKPFRCHEKPVTCEGWKALYRSNDAEYLELMGAFVKRDEQQKEWAEQGRCHQCGAAVKPGSNLCHVHIDMANRIAAAIRNPPAKVRAEGRAQ